MSKKKHIHRYKYKTYYSIFGVCSLYECRCGKSYPSILIEENAKEVKLGDV